MRSAVVSVMILSSSLFATSALLAAEVVKHHGPPTGGEVTAPLSSGVVVAAFAESPTITRSEVVAISRDPRSFAAKGDTRYQAIARASSHPSKR
jgi:hypothetical protein